MSHTARVAVVAAILVTTAACTTPGTPIADHSSVGSTSAETTSAQPWTATSATLAGVQGGATYDVEIPQVQGPDLAVVERFNNSARTYVNQQLGQDGTFTLDGVSQRVILDKNVVAGVLEMSFMMTDPMAAHPYGLVGTFVIRKSTAQPVMLTDLFTDANDGIQRLSKAADELVTAKLGNEFTFHDGLAPHAKNFANWIPTSTGLEIHFNDAQVGPHAVGMVVVEVPWSTFDGVLAPNVH